MTLLILDLILEQNPLKTLTSLSQKRLLKTKPAYIAVCWRLSQVRLLAALGASVPAPGALTRAYKFPATTSFSRLYPTYINMKMSMTNLCIILLLRN
jgi:hypothetical protein